MADQSAGKQPTQGMAKDGRKGQYDGTSMPKDTRGAGDGGPTGPGEQSDGFHGGQSNAAYHGHGQLGKDKVPGQNNENGVSRDD